MAKKIFALLLLPLFAACAHGPSTSARGTASLPEQMVATCLGKNLSGDIVLKPGRSFWDRSASPSTNPSYYSEIPAGGKYQLIGEMMPDGNSKLTIKYQADSATTSILATGLNFVEFELGWTPKRNGDLTTCQIKQ